MVHLGTSEDLRVLEMIALSLPGRILPLRESHVFLPIITALPGEWVVTDLKCCMSFASFHGKVPYNPMPPSKVEARIISNVRR